MTWWCWCCYCASKHNNMCSSMPTTLAPGMRHEATIRFQDAQRNPLQDLLGVSSFSEHYRRSDPGRQGRCWHSLTTHFKHHLGPEIMRIKSHICWCYSERANSTFRLKNIAILEFGINAAKTDFKHQDTNPTIRASYQLLHERMKDERQH